MELVNELYAAEGEMMEGVHTQNKVESIPLAIRAEAQLNLALLLAPFAPYLAHELWEMLGEDASLLRAPWPKFDPALAKEDEVEIPVQVNGRLRSRIIVPPDAPEDVVRERALADEKIQAMIAGKVIVKKIVVPGKLVNIVVR
jgi:leucyl-tRNA synthetase